MSEYIFNECVLSPTNTFTVLMRRVEGLRVSLGGVWYGAEKTTVRCLPLCDEGHYASNICVINPHVTFNERNAPLM